MAHAFITANENLRLEFRKHKAITRPYKYRENIVKAS